MTLDELKAFLSNLTVIETCKLALDLEDAWGVERPGDKVIRYRAVTAYGAPMPPEYDRAINYYLDNPGTNKLYLMQQLRKHLGWDLAKLKAALAEPKVLLLTTEHAQQANNLIKDLAVFGAVVSKG